MTHRKLLVGALALAAGLAACSTEEAGPTIDNTNTGAIQALVLTDTTNAAIASYTARAGIQVNVYRQGDTVLLRRQATNAQGKVYFNALEPGTYIVSPVVRQFTNFPTNQFFQVTVAPHQVDSSAVFRFRQGGRVSGFIGITYTSQNGPVTVRSGAGTLVELLRDTSVAKTGKYVVVATTTTDASGFYILDAAPFTQPYAIRFRTSGLAGAADSLLFNSDTTKKSSDSVVVFKGATTGVTGGSVTQNLTFGYQNRITGRVYRDNNVNATYDGTSENLIPADTVNMILLNSDASKVLSTFRATQATSTSATYTFSSLQPGTYKLTEVKATSRTPSAVPESDTVTVVVPSSRGTVTANYALKPAP